VAGFLYTHKDGQDGSADVTTHNATGSYFQPLYAMFGQYDGLMHDWLFSGVDAEPNGVDDASGIDFIYFWKSCSFTWLGVMPWPPRLLPL